MQRDFKRGFEWFGQREQSTEVKSLKNFKHNNINNSTVLVYSDMGLGDGIMFSRYLPYLKTKFDKIIVYTRKPITAILQRSFPDIEFCDTNLSQQKYDTSLLMDAMYLI